jgi:hypothetical protein
MIVSKAFSVIDIVLLQLMNRDAFSESDNYTKTIFRRTAWKYLNASRLLDPIRYFYINIAANAPEISIRLKKAGSVE